jgi:MoaA/NifB/PqqE/SkfB family radical SAM enzyme/hydroxymethylpyrimidine pyrophosphatase-like HAD family hydrolase
MGKSMGDLGGEEFSLMPKGFYWGDEGPFYLAATGIEYAGAGVDAEDALTRGSGLARELERWMLREPGTRGLMRRWGHDMASLMAELGRNPRQSSADAQALYSNLLQFRLFLKQRSEMRTSIDDEDRQFVKAVAGLDPAGHFEDDSAVSALQGELIRLLESPEAALSVLEKLPPFHFGLAARSEYFPKELRQDPGMPAIVAIQILCALDVIPFHYTLRQLLSYRDQESQNEFFNPEFVRFFRERLSAVEDTSLIRYDPQTGQFDSGKIPTDGDEEFLTEEDRAALNRPFDVREASQNMEVLSRFLGDLAEKNVGKEVFLHEVVIREKFPDIRITSNSLRSAIMFYNLTSESYLFIELPNAVGLYRVKEKRKNRRSELRGDGREESWPVGFMPTLADYMRDIEEAERNGGILEVGDVRDVGNDYSHFKLISASNTKHLSADGKMLLEGILKMGGVGPAEVLDLGPGTGLEVSEMSQLAEEMGRPLAIDTLSLVPLAPHFLVLGGIRDISRTARIYLEGNREDREVANLVKEPDLELALALQRRGYPIFKILRNPYLRRQWIADLRTFKMEPARYSFIYDRYGAYAYASLSSPKVQSDPMAILKYILSLLRNDGVFFFNSSIKENETAVLRSDPVLKDFTVIEWGGLQNCLLARKDSRIVRQFAGDPRARISRDGYVYSVEDSETVRDILAQLMFKRVPGKLRAVSREPAEAAAGARPRSEIRSSDKTFKIPVERILRGLERYRSEFPSGIVERISDFLDSLKDQEISLEDLKKRFQDTPEAARKRIAFTGAPYGGKTEFLKKLISTEPSEYVYLPEVIHPLRYAGISLVDRNGQRTVYALKYLLERAASEVYPDRIVLTDRGTLDGAAYWPGGAEDFFREAGGQRGELDRYYGVIHLQSVVENTQTAHEYKGRIETARRVREIEELLQRFWRSHPRYYFIPHTDWEQKTAEIRPALRFLAEKSFAGARAPKVFDYFHNGERYRFPNIAGYDFSRETLETFFDPDPGKAEVPLVLDLHYKAPCGLRCLFCYSEGGLVDERHAVDERKYPAMQPEDIKEAIRQYAALGGHTLILLSIGEPLTRMNDFLEYARLAKELGVRVVTFTNMLPITPETARQLCEAEVNMLLKLNHLDPKINDQLSGRKEPYEYVEYRGRKIPRQLAEILEAYRDRPDLLALSSDINRLNRDNILEMSRWAYETLGTAHFRKHLYYFGLAQENRDLLALSEDEVEAFERELYEFDRRYGYEYPGSARHKDQYSFDIRRFLNNNLSPSGFPIRTFSHYLAGFYHSSGAVRPRFGYKLGIKAALKDLVKGNIDVTEFFFKIFTHIRFFRHIRSVLSEIEKSYQNDRKAGLDPEQSNSGRQDRWEKAYRLTREIKKYLANYGDDLTAPDRKLLRQWLARATELARENPLFWIPEKPGIYVLGEKLFRVAYPGGEEFRFFTLERTAAFYSDPYQITYSITPPGHEQQIHGHFSTPELTVSLGENMGFNVHRFEDGKIAEIRKFSVPQFSGAHFRALTPHAVTNLSLDAPNRNMTVKYGKQVTDRWDISEGPSWKEYTFESRVAAPQIEAGEGVTVYSHDKGSLWHRLMTIEPNASYSIPMPSGKEKGLFVAEGEVEASGIGGESAPVRASEKEVLYLVQGAEAGLVSIVNRGDRPAILVEVVLKESMAERFERAKRQTYRAILSDIDGVLTRPETGEISLNAVEALVTRLEEGVPVLLMSGRNDRSLGKGYRKEASSLEDVAAIFRAKLSEKGKEHLLGLLFLGAENGAVIHDGYPENDPRRKNYDPGVRVDILSPAQRETILDHLKKSSGLFDEHVRIVRKDHGFALTDALGSRINAIAEAVRFELEQRRILDRMEVAVDGNEVHVYPKGVDKILGIDFLRHEFSLEDREIAAFGDKGAPGEPDHKILNRAGGFSTGESDSESPFMVRLKTLNGYLPGDQSFLWAFERLRIEAPAQRAELRTGPAQTDRYGTRMNYYLLTQLLMSYGWLPRNESASLVNENLILGSSDFLFEKIMKPSVAAVVVQNLGRGRLAELSGNDAARMFYLLGAIDLSGYIPPEIVRAGAPAGNGIDHGRVEKILGLAEERAGSKGWTNLLSNHILLGYELPRAMGLLSKQTRVFDFLTGANLVGGLYGGELWTVDNRMNEVVLARAFENWWGQYIRNAGTTASIYPPLTEFGLMYHSQEDVLEEGFLLNWFRHMRSGDVVYLKSVPWYLSWWFKQDHPSQSWAASTMVYQWADELIARLPAGVVVIVTELAGEWEKTVGWSKAASFARYLLQTGRFEDEKTRLLPDTARRLDALNQTARWRLMDIGMLGALSITLPANAMVSFLRKKRAADGTFAPSPERPRSELRVSEADLNALAEEFEKKREGFDWGQVFENAFLQRKQAPAAPGQGGRHLILFPRKIYDEHPYFDMAVDEFAVALTDRLKLPENKVQVLQAEFTYRPLIARRLQDRPVRAYAKRFRVLKVVGVTDSSGKEASYYVSFSPHIRNQFFGGRTVIKNTEARLPASVRNHQMRPFARPLKQHAQWLRVSPAEKKLILSQNRPEGTAAVPVAFGELETAKPFTVRFYESYGRLYMVDVEIQDDPEARRSGINFEISRLQWDSKKEQFVVDGGARYQLVVPWEEEAFWETLKMIGRLEPKAVLQRLEEYQGSGKLPHGVAFYRDERQLSPAEQAREVLSNAARFYVPLMRSWLESMARPGSQEAFDRLYRWQMGEDPKLFLAPAADYEVPERKTIPGEPAIPGKPQSLRFFANDRFQSGHFVTLYKRDPYSPRRRVKEPLYVYLSFSGASKNTDEKQFLIAVPLDKEGRELVQVHYQHGNETRRGKKADAATGFVPVTLVKGDALFLVDTRTGKEIRLHLVPMEGENTVTLQALSDQALVSMKAFYWASVLADKLPDPALRQIFDKIENFRFSRTLGHLDRLLSDPKLREYEDKLLKIKGYLRTNSPFDAEAYQPLPRWIYEIPELEIKTIYREESEDLETLRDQLVKVLDSTEHAAGEGDGKAEIQLIRFLIQPRVIPTTAAFRNALSSFLARDAKVSPDVRPELRGGPESLFSEIKREAETSGTVLDTPGMLKTVPGDFGTPQHGRAEIRLAEEREASLSGTREQERGELRAADTTARGVEEVIRLMEEEEPVGDPVKALLRNYFAGNIEEDAALDALTAEIGFRNRRDAVDYLGRITAQIRKEVIRMATTPANAITDETLEEQIRTAVAINDLGILSEILDRAERGGRGVQGAWEMLKIMREDRVNSYKNVSLGSVYARILRIFEGEKEKREILQKDRLVESFVTSFPEHLQTRARALFAERQEMRTPGEIDFGRKLAEWAEASMKARELSEQGQAIEEEFNQRTINGAVLPLGLLLTGLILSKLLSPFLEIVWVQLALYGPPMAGILYYAIALVRYAKPLSLRFRELKEENASLEDRNEELREQMLAALPARKGRLTDIAALIEGSLEVAKPHHFWLSKNDGVIAGEIVDFEKFFSEYTVPWYAFEAYRVLETDAREYESARDEMLLIVGKFLQDPAQRPEPIVQSMGTVMDAVDRFYRDCARFGLTPRSEIRADSGLEPSGLKDAAIRAPEGPHTLLYEAAHDDLPTVLRLLRILSEKQFDVREVYLVDPWYEPSPEGEHYDEYPRPKSLRELIGIFESAAKSAIVNREEVLEKGFRREGTRLRFKFSEAQKPLDVILVAQDAKNFGRSAMGDSRGASLTLVKWPGFGSFLEDDFSFYAKNIEKTAAGGLVYVVNAALPFRFLPSEVAGLRPIPTGYAIDGNGRVRYEHLSDINLGALFVKESEVSSEDIALLMAMDHALEELVSKAYYYAPKGAIVRERLAEWPGSWRKFREAWQKLPEDARRRVVEQIRKIRDERAELLKPEGVKILEFLFEEANLPGKKGALRLEDKPLSLKDFFRAGLWDKEIGQIVLVADNTGTLTPGYDKQLSESIRSPLLHFVRIPDNHFVVDSGDPIHNLEHFVYEPFMTDLRDSPDTAGRPLGRFHFVGDSGTKRKGFGPNAYDEPAKPWDTRTQFDYLRALAEYFYDELLKRPGHLAEALKEVGDDRLKAIRDEHLGELDRLGAEGFWQRQTETESSQKRAYHFHLLPEDLEKILAPIYVYEVGAKVTLGTLLGGRTAFPAPFTAPIYERFSERFGPSAPGFYTVSGDGFIDIAAESKQSGAQKTLDEKIYPSLDPEKITVVFVLGDNTNDIPMFGVRLPPGFENAVVIPVFLNHDASFSGSLPEGVFLPREKSDTDSLDGSVRFLEFLASIRGKRIREIPDFPAKQWRSELRGTDVNIATEVLEDLQKRLFSLSEDAWARLSVLEADPATHEYRNDLLGTLYPGIDYEKKIVPHVSSFDAAKWFALVRLTDDLHQLETVFSDREGRANVGGLAYWLFLDINALFARNPDFLTPYLLERIGANKALRAQAVSYGFEEGHFEGRFSYGVREISDLYRALLDQLKFPEGTVWKDFEKEKQLERRFQGILRGSPLGTTPLFQSDQSFVSLEVQQALFDLILLSRWMPTLDERGNDVPRCAQAANGILRLYPGFSEIESIRHDLSLAAAMTSGCQFEEGRFVLKKKKASYEQILDEVSSFTGMQASKGVVVPGQNEHGISFSTLPDMMPDLAQRFREHAAAEKKRPEDLKILDVGTDRGAVAVGFSEETGADVTSVEIEPARHSFSRDFLKHLGRGKGWWYPRLKLLQGDFLEHDIRDYDAIYFFFSTGEGREAAFAEAILEKLNREMKDGAIFISPLFARADNIGDAVLRKFFGESRRVHYRKTWIGDLPAIVVSANAARLSGFPARQDSMDFSRSELRGARFARMVLPVFLAGAFAGQILARDVPAMKISSSAVVQAPTLDEAPDSASARSGGEISGPEKRSRLARDLFYDFLDRRLAEPPSAPATLAARFIAVFSPTLNNRGDVLADIEYTRQELENQGPLHPEVLAEMDRSIANYRKEYRREWSRMLARVIGMCGSLLGVAYITFSVIGRSVREPWAKESALRRTAQSSVPQLAETAGARDQ